MEKQNWKKVLYVGIGVLIISALAFFGLLFTQNNETIYQVLINIFIWFGVTGGCLVILWTLPYVFGWIGKVINYYRYR